MLVSELNQLLRKPQRLVVSHICLFLVRVEFFFSGSLLANQQLSQLHYLLLLLAFNSFQIVPMFVPQVSLFDLVLALKTDHCLPIFIIY